MSVLQKLTEGIVDRSLQREGAALLDKWERTGLLEGLNGDQQKQGMARLLENQASQLLKEATSMAASDVEGFASVAFPIVRRVFGGLIANDLVSVQPMSLPSGLIFFMDFTYTDDLASAGAAATESIYGGGVVAKGLVDGVSLTGANAEKSFYALNNGYSSPTGSVDNVVQTDYSLTLTDGSTSTTTLDGSKKKSELTGSAQTALKVIQHDPDISDNSYVAVFEIAKSSLTDAQWNEANCIAIDTVAATAQNALASGKHLNGATLVRRLTRQNPDDATKIMLVYTKATAFNDIDTDNDQVKVNFPKADRFDTGGAIGSVVGKAPWGLEGADDTDNNTFNGEVVDTIREIDIKVDSIAVTAVSKKLKAKWTPELGQDLNAYHNLDAEVELTQVLSEQIALEIDREIVQELVKGAKASTMYWSRRPGKFLDRTTGTQVGADVANESLMGADFTGTVSEWYETLVETINDVSAQIHRKTLRGGANFCVCSPEVANILEFTSGFRANITHDDDKGDIGAVKAGSLSRKWDVWVDPYFPRNLILVGRKGGSFLESGFVYAPYVPLQITPTIFGTEDFVPRKGVMTRYAKKMVRPDMYGLVVVQDFTG
tara:strand:- start:123 stop:1928 length:1806 start_codon:yes stop_codon:yes gene_type:complete